MRIFLKCGPLLAIFGGQVNMLFLPFDSVWFEVADGDFDAFSLAKRHYSFRLYCDGRRSNEKYPNRHLFVGPGKKIVLMTRCGKALLVWRRCLNWQNHVTVFCSIFRNESDWLSSRLISEAEVFPFTLWPENFAYTMVNPQKVKSSNPGYCFLKAGWERVGVTKKGLIVLRRQRPKEFLCRENL